MDGKRYFKECCRDKGLDCDALFQIGKSNAAKSDRLKYHYSYLSRKESQIFVVCYFEKENVYIAWNLKEKKAAKKSDFSVKRSDLDLPLVDKIVSVKKAIEYEGWGEETVLAFTPERVSDFLERYYR